MKYKLFGAFVAALCVAILSVRAQENVETATPSAQDSIIHDLQQQLLQQQQQLQDMQMQRILMQEALENAGKSAQMDSLAQAHRRQQIDSLRLITPGAPLVVDGDTLLTLYAKKGGMLASDRAEAAKEKIEDIGHYLSFGIDSVYVFESEIFSDIMIGEEVIMTITDTDALWLNRTRQDLAQEYAQIISSKIVELHKTYGLRTKLWGLLLALIIIVGQYIAIKLTFRLFRHWRRKLVRRVMARLKPIRIKDYEFLDTHRQGILLLGLYRIIRIVFIIFQLFISVPLLFSIFPETKSFTFTILGYIWNPFKDIILSVIGYLPNVFKIIVIYFCFRYLVRGIRYLSSEIESGNLKLTGFYPDWAMPTFYILRALCYSLMFVMIWPLLPSSNSEIFQGVSVFIGLIVSLGSTSIIGNVMAGMVMTYMRPFRLGDFIKVGDTVGEVIEKTVLVTRIRTRKNEVVTIQNSNLLGSQTSNYSEAAKTYGLIVHTKVTIGYDVPWQLVKKIMESAAADTPGIKKNPKPFMMTTALDDFYVEYEINAFTTDAKNLTHIYSELHQNLLKRFFEAGVEIMSPHIYARRDGIDTQMPQDYLTPQNA